MNRKKITRRTFVALAGASGIAALWLKPGMRLGEKLIPYVNPPKYPKPGEWAFYSTTCRECPAGCGMIMWHRDGRVTKAEGNPIHPINNGKLCIRGQSSVQGEYDANRIQQVLIKDESGDFTGSDWNSAFSFLKEQLSTGKRPVVISDLQTGSLEDVMEEFTLNYNSDPVFYEAFNYESLRMANRQVYGTDLIPRYNISGCDLVISFGADFLATWLSPVEYAAEFSNIHSLKDNHIGKIIYFGPNETLTAINSDSFYLTRPGSEAAIIYNIALRLREKGGIRNNDLEKYLSALNTTQVPDVDDQVIEKIVDAIMVARSPMILAGRPNDGSTEGVNTVKAASLLNELLGNHSRIDFSQYHALSKTIYKKELYELFRTLTSDHILIIHNTNPVYSEPGIKELIRNAGITVYIGPVRNETAEISDWILPTGYYLEEWGDYEPWKGTVSFIRPVMNPLYDTMSAGDIFIELTPRKNKKAFKEVVKEHRNRTDRNNPFPVTEKSLREGYVQKKTAKPEYHPVFTSPPEISVTKNGTGSWYLIPHASLFFYDGRLANREWLQEIPNPLSNIVWQSWADVNADSAKEAGIKDGEVIKITSSLGSLEVPVRLTDKISPGTISIETGRGHTAMGPTANTGVNVFSILNLLNSEILPTVKIEKTGTMGTVLYLNQTKEQHDRELVRFVELKDLVSGSAEKDEITMPLPEGYDKNRDLYPPHPHEKHRWAMAIDLQSCIGCKACEAACYAENNIPVTGREGCEQGLEMSWLKVPPYKIKNNRVAFIPVPCQHCDAAPCEPVCPTYASSHTQEGLNAQIYNRCIGTRYCSNNCPYKVRRFNWKNIHYTYPATLRLNPEVTVRERGVMEKCTFCVQRIRNAEYAAKKEERKIEDGEIVTACAQTCPTNAIVFGDLLNENSRVRKLFDHDRRYQLLHELNTKPAVVYLKKIIQEDGNL